MKRYIALILLASACAHKPLCGNPEGAKVIVTGKETCEVRIRQVTVGSDLKIPQSLKGASLAQFKLEWIEPDLKDGRIELGHFVLLPSSQLEEKKP